MIEYLNAINTTKKNIIRDAEDVQQAEKSFPAFPVLRSLSYFPECIGLVNEINIRSLDEYSLTPMMKFEFFLDTLPIKKRYAKWAKSEKEENIELVVEFTGQSYSKVSEIIDLIPETKLQHFRDLKKQKDK